MTLNELMEKVPFVPAWILKGIDREEVIDVEVVHLEKWSEKAMMFQLKYTYIIDGFKFNVVGCYLFCPIKQYKAEYGKMFLSR